MAMCIHVDCDKPYDLKTKMQKRNKARKSDEAINAARKVEHQQNGSLTTAQPTGKKGKSSVPQAKAKKR